MFFAACFQRGITVPKRFHIFCISLFIVTFSCTPPAPEPLVAEDVDDAAIADEAQTENWLAYGRTHN